MSVIFNNSLLGCLGYGRKHRLVSWWFALLLNKHNSLIFFIFSVFSLLSCSKPSYGAMPSRLWHNCHMAKRKAFSYVCRQHWEKCDTARPPSFQTSPVIQLEKATAVSEKQRERWQAVHVSKSTYLMGPASALSHLGKFPASVDP